MNPKLVICFVVIIMVIVVTLSGILFSFRNVFGDTAQFFNRTNSTQDLEKPRVTG